MNFDFLSCHKFIGEIYEMLEANFYIYSRKYKTCSQNYFLFNINKDHIAHNNKQNQQSTSTYLKIYNIYKIIYKTL